MVEFYDGLKLDDYGENATKLIYMARGLYLDAILAQGDLG